MNQPENKNSREALLEAAQTLFVEKGYEAVSTREIADLAGVNLGAIQYHFGSKAKLFMESICRLMEGCGMQDPKVRELGEINSTQDAANKLCLIILTMLNNLLRHEGPQPCRVMFREIFSATSADEEMFEALISTVVRDFIKPVDDTLLAVLKHLLPKAKPAELEVHAQSIVGQCAFYLTHGPFAERLRGKDFTASPNFEFVASHIARFSLKAMDCDEKIIESAIEEVIVRAAQ